MAAGVKLLDPKIALFFALLALAVGVWWILGIVSAARYGRITWPANLVPVALIVLVALGSLYARQLGLSRVAG